MKRIVIFHEDNKRDRVRIAAGLGAELVPYSPLWPMSAGPHTLIIDDDDARNRLPIAEGARVVSILSKVSGESYGPCSIHPTDSARKIRRIVEEAELMRGVVFRPFAEQWSSLSSREAEVIMLAAMGLTGQDTADKLTLSLRTVQTHMSAARRRKLDHAHIPRITGLLVRDGIINLASSDDYNKTWLKRWRGMTDRQREIAKLSMLLGERGVAARANLTVKTVSAHRRIIFDRLRGDAPSYSYDATHMAMDAAVCGVHPEVNR